MKYAKHTERAIVINLVSITEIFFILLIFFKTLKFPTRLLRQLIQLPILIINLNHLKNNKIWILFKRHLGLSGTSPSLTMPPQPSTLTDHVADQQQQMDQGTMTQGSARAICAALPGLVSRQIQVCQAHPNTIQSVSDGARKVHHFFFKT